MLSIQLKLDDSRAEILKSIVDEVDARDMICLVRHKTSYGYACEVFVNTAEEAFFLGMAVRNQMLSVSAPVNA